VPDVVMVAAPHPDDEVLGCGGSIACHADAGRQVFVLYLSSGERGCPDRLPANARALREQEAAQAMETLGIPAANLRFLGFPDGGINPALLDQVGVVTSALRELRPQLLYLPHPDDASFDHRAAFTLCWRAAGMAGSRNFPEWGTSPHWVPAVLGYEVWSPIREPAYFEDIDGVMDRKLAALACYRSQTPAAKGTGQASHVGAPAAFLPGFRGAVTTGGHREAFTVLRADRVI
jgi:LmbE family N-acetylglucosaminyl deacetylase